MRYKVIIHYENTKSYSLAAFNPETNQHYTQTPKTRKNTIFNYTTAHQVLDYWFNVGKVGQLIIKSVEIKEVI